MALTEGDRAICREIAREIVHEVLEQHILMCPYGKMIWGGKFFIIGICLGSGLISSSVVAIAMKIFGN